MAKDHVDIEVAVPQRSFPLFPIIVILLILLIAALAADIYLYRSQHQTPAYKGTTFTRLSTSPAHLKTSKMSTTDSMKSTIRNMTKFAIPVSPIELSPPQRLDNWCGSEVRDIDGSKYKILYDLTKVEPFMTQPKKYSVEFTVNLFVWVPVESLHQYAPFCGIFILPQIKPKQAFLYDFFGYDSGNQRVRTLPLHFDNEEQIDGIKIASNVTYGTELHKFEFQSMKNKTTHFKAFHAKFFLDLTKKRMIFQSCLNDTSSVKNCHMQLNETVELDDIPSGLTTAVYITMGLDQTRAIRKPRKRFHIQLNATQALCCEIFEERGLQSVKRVKLCRVKETDRVVPCPKDWQDETCEIYRGGH